MSARLGKFLREIEIEGVTFICRGLTVGEYADLAQLNLLRLTDRLYIEVAVCGLVGWEGSITDENGNLVEYQDGKIDAEWLPDKICIQIGKFIYHDMTMLPQGVADKFKGFIRFLYWNSQDDNQSQSETFNCQTCLEKGYAISRPCGRFDMEYREDFLRSDMDAPDAESIAESRDKSRKKYGNKKLSEKRSAKRNQHLKKLVGDDYEEGDNAPAGRRGYMVLDDYKYPECPVSWVDEWIKVFGEVMYHAEKSEMTLFGGGIFDQPYQIFRASKVVKSEYNKIESERLEKDKKKRGNK